MNDLKRIFKMGDIRSVAYVSGLMMLMTLVFTYSIATIGLILGGRVYSSTLILGFVTSCLLLARFSTRRSLLWSVVVNIATWCIAIVISIIMCDCSCDGLAYHMPTVYAYSDGWNPIWDKSYREELSIWPYHYAKALELISSCIFKLTETWSMESGKSVNFIFATAAFLTIYGWIKRIRPEMTKWSRLILSIIVAGNPVWICQMFTYYIDFALYYYVLFTVIFSINLSQGKNSVLNAVCLAGVIILAIGTKFNHCFIEMMTMIAIIGWLWIAKERKVAVHIFKISLLAGILGVLVFSFHPYLTNWIENGNPFYPLMGDGAIDIMTCNTPELYRGHNRVLNFLLSIYGNRVISFPIFDSRVGGFGPMFGILLPVCLCVILISEIKGRKLSVVGYATLWILASCLFFSQSWWARYNPQLWLIVPIAYYVVSGWSSKILKISGQSVIGIITILNIGSCTVSPILGGLKLAAYRECLYEVLKGKKIRSHVGRMWASELSRHGVIPEIVEEEDIPEEKRVGILYTPDTPVIWCWIETDDDDKARIDSLYENHDVNLLHGELRDTLRQWRKRKS